MDGLGRVCWLVVGPRGRDGRVSAEGLRRSAARRRDSFWGDLVAWIARKIRASSDLKDIVFCGVVESCSREVATQAESGLDGCTAWMVYNHVNHISVN